MDIHNTIHDAHVVCFGEFVIGIIYQYDLYYPIPKWRHWCRVGLSNYLLRVLNDFG